MAENELDVRREYVNTKDDYDTAIERLNLLRAEFLAESAVCAELARINLGCEAHAALRESLVLAMVKPTIDANAALAKLTIAEVKMRAFEESKKKAKP